MVIFLKLLKWLGILVLILLALALLLLLIVLFVPFRYKAAAEVDDPESHSEFPLEVFRDRSNVIAEITWLFGIIKLQTIDQLCAVLIFLSVFHLLFLLVVIAAPCAFHSRRVITLPRR